MSLFHRHARGLILTEQGELLYRTAHEVFMKLEAARTKLTDSRERPNGEFGVTTPGIGINWLIPRLGEFIDLYPDIRINLLVTDEELDLSMRQADVGIRMRQPSQPDLIQRKLFSVAFPCVRIAGLSQAFRHTGIDDLDQHRILLLGGGLCRPTCAESQLALETGRNGKGPRTPHMTVNNVIGVMRACQRGLGIALLPDYLVEENGGLVQLFGEADRSHSTAISSIRKNSNPSRACRYSATSWLRTRSGGTFRFSFNTACFGWPIASSRRREFVRHQTICDCAWLTCGYRRCAGRRRSHNSIRCCAGCVSSQNHRCTAMFPSGRRCRPPRRQILKPGPFRGPVFYHVPISLSESAQCSKRDRRSARR